MWHCFMTNNSCYEKVKLWAKHCNVQGGIGISIDLVPRYGGSSITEISFERNPNGELMMAMLSVDQANFDPIECG